MYDRRPSDNPPEYSPPSHFSQSLEYGPTSDTREYDLHSPPPGSYYIEDVPPQHFYKWSSAPGIIRILETIVILLCLGIFACVASTLAWDLNYYGGSLGSGYTGAGGFYGGGMAGNLYYGSGGMGGMGSNSYYPGLGLGAGTDPKAAKGFMIAMAAIIFIAALVFFVMSINKSSVARSRRFYLLLMISSGAFAGLELIASIVYIMGVNPTASAGSSSYSQVRLLCAQFNSPVGSSLFINQYLYHYCVVEAQEAVAIVCGFLVSLTFGLICFFAQRVRHKIWKYGKPNILWDKPFVEEEVGPNVEEWIKQVPHADRDETETLPYSDKPHYTVSLPGVDVRDSPQAHYHSENYQDNEYFAGSTFAPSCASKAFSSAASEAEAARERQSRPPAKGRKRGRHGKEDESLYETDYTTGAESCDDIEEEWDSLYPPITSDPIRQEYKREFDLDHREYKQICSEMDEINDRISFLSKQLDVLTEDSSEYQGAAEEYNRLKNLKKTSDYQSKRLKSRRLKNKLSHIKQMVSEYDQQRG